MKVAGCRSACTPTPRRPSSRATAALLREALLHPRWRGETLVFSGVTDCYPPIESKLRLTRACLEVCVELRNPVGIITKSTLVERDLDVLRELTAHARVHVVISVPFLDEDHARAIEPWAPTPTRRLKTIEKLAAAGIPVGINVAPIVPGLSDSDVIPLLEAAAAAGARGDADDTPTTFTRPSPQQEATRRSGQLGLFE